jgi:DNA-binding CsgD family transcriptional regulator
LSAVDVVLFGGDGTLPGLQVDPAGDRGFDEVDHVDVLKVIASLPAQQRRVLALRYDGYTPAEITDVLRTTPNNVRATLHHARKRLRTGDWGWIGRTRSLCWYFGPSYIGSS